LGAVRDFLVRKWNGQVLTEAYEVDDELAIQAQPNSVICSIDKDLRQIPGEHYNPVKDEFEVVDSEQAALTLYTSMLVGDSSDNLRGIDGLGPVKAGRLLAGLDSKEAHLKVQSIYDDHGRDFFHSYRLFRLLRSIDEYHEVMSEIKFSETEGKEATTMGEGSMVGIVSEPDTQ
jgi:5'-3' exonuclease